MNTICNQSKPLLNAGTIYSADNGELICIHCAGMTALYTGKDRSGMKVTPMTDDDAREWKELMDTDLACERGCTKHMLPCAS